jgi:hypothetical protein
MPASTSELFIVDNSDCEWKVRNYLANWCDLSKTIDIATGCFEIGALLALKDKWQQVDSIRTPPGRCSCSPLLAPAALFVCPAP